MTQNPGFGLFARPFLLRNNRFSDLKTGMLDFSDKLLRIGVNSTFAQCSSAGHLCSSSDYGAAYNYSPQS